MGDLLFIHSRTFAAGVDKKSDAIGEENRKAPLSLRRKGKQAF
jgi:hypothetical protein